MQLTFLEHMERKRTPPHIKLLTATEFEAVVKAEKHPNFNELLCGGFTKPFFDSDAYYAEAPASTELTRMFDCFKTVLHRLLANQPGFTPDQLLYGSRHGIDPKHPEKPHRISFRAYLPGYKVEYARMARWIQDAGLQGSGEGLLDISPYKPGEQLLACMCCSKGLVTRKGQKQKVLDRRILQPVGQMLSMDKYLVQHLNGDEVELQLPSCPPDAQGPAAQPAELQDHAGSDFAQHERVDMELVCKVLALLHVSRWDDRDSWVKYGIALKNFGGEDLKQAWKQASKRSSKYNEAEAETTWASFGNSTPIAKLKPISFGTICKHAKQDDLAGYTKVRQDHAQGDCYASSIDFALKTNGSHVALAKVMYAVLGAIYKATSIGKSKAWFCFDGTRWKKHDDGQVLRDVTAKLHPLFVLKEQQLEAEVNQCTDLGKKELLEKLRASCHRVGNSLLDSNNRRSVIREFAALVQDPEFEAMLDTDVNLLGFHDGIYDLSVGKFRAGIPSDHLTKSVGYKYPVESGGYQISIDQFLSMVLPKVDVREYVLDLLAQKLCGACIKRVCIHTGLGGDNGKTTLLELFLQVMGEYGYKAKIQFFTTKRLESGRADPDSAMLHGRRFVFGEEPDEGARLNLGLIKDLSGGDGTDGGGRNRLNKIDYSSRFVDTDLQVDEDKHHFKKNISIKDQFALWAPDFMRMLLQRYKHGYLPPVPVSIAASTSSYLDANNSFAQFQQKLIEKASKSHEHFTVSEALSKWKEFAVECELGKSPNKDELVEGLTLLLGTPLLTEKMVEKIRRRNAWWGWRLRVKPLSDDEVSATEDTVVCGTVKMHVK
ncbi:hypothetical protein ABBQ32_002283 [Trebouxia sp. C0010 RCD-2024]